MLPNIVFKHIIGLRRIVTNQLQNIIIRKKKQFFKYSRQILYIASAQAFYWKLYTLEEKVLFKNITNYN